MMSAGTHIFCPRCGTENGTEQGYCRQCGQGLSDIQLVLEGKISKSKDRLRAAEKWIKAGNSILLAFILIAFLIAALGMTTGGPVLIAIGMLNVLCGALIGFPLVFFGNVRLIQARRLVSQIQEHDSSALKGAAQQLTTPRTAELGEPRAPGSITEHTTVLLPKANATRRQR